MDRRARVVLEDVLEVVDATPPTISQCPELASISADADCQALVPDLTLGVLAFDNCAGAIELTQDLPLDTPVTAGNVPVLITATDAAGNSSTRLVTLAVLDVTPPALTLNGADPLYIECGGGSFADSGATAVDACDPEVPVTASGAVDTGTLGTYRTSPFRKARSPCSTPRALQLRRAAR